jgi:hypothetical protein
LKEFSSRRFHDDPVNRFSCGLAVIMELTWSCVQLEVCGLALDPRGQDVVDSDTHRE